MRPWSLIALFLITCSPQSQQSLEVESDLITSHQSRLMHGTMSDSGWQLTARTEGPWWRFSLRGERMLLRERSGKVAPLTLRLTSKSEVVDIHLTKKGGRMAGLAFLKRGPVKVSIYEGDRAIGMPIAEGHLALGQRGAP